MTISHAARAVAIGSAGLLTLAFVSTFVALGAGSTSLCGTSITENLKLKEDLVCSGNGIRVGADGITIDLNGHRIIGPGTALPTVGIVIGGHSHVKIVGPGTVTKFRTGILIASSDHVKVEKLKIVENGRLVPSFASSDGIRVWSSTNVKIEDAKIERNGNDGVELMSSTGVEIEESKIRENGAGIHFVGSTGNSVEENKITRNTCGVKGPTDGNAFEDNKFKDNIADSCA